jgi:hypothetical protein
MNRPTAEALSKTIHDAVITAIMEFFGPSDQVPQSQPENGKAAAAAILAPPPTPPVLTDRWARKKPDRPYETIEAIPVAVEKRHSAGTDYIQVSWQNPQGRGYLYATVWDKVLFPFVESRLRQKTTFHVTRKDKFINIVGLRA